MDSVIYSGKVRHRRFVPKQHKFSYRLFMFCFDINNIENEFNKIPQVSIEKFNWFSFKRKNYLSNPEVPLDQCARELVQSKYGSYPKGKIYLLTHLSCLGYCFNPISLYFIFEENSDQLEYLIVEVTNTPWGEKHCYVLANPEKPAKDIYYFRFKKELHVSPFMTMDYDYQFHLKVNSKQIILQMDNYQNESRHFDATLTLGSLSKEESPKKIFLQHPFMTYKVSAGIYWQAFLLWLKGISFQTHPRKKGNSNE